MSGGVLTQGTALCHQIWSWTQLSDIRDQVSHVFTLFFHICTSIYISLLLIIICYKCILWTYSWGHLVVPYTEELISRQFLDENSI